VVEVVQFFHQVVDQLELEDLAVVEQQDHQVDPLQEDLDQQEQQTLVVAEEVVLIVVLQDLLEELVDQE
tara:strand:+ start:165 stop:371 length:207 start_codon:yes stop_codon:yes gene_type:complete